MNSESIIDSLLNIDDLVQRERRRRNQQLMDFIDGKNAVYNGEDLMRLVGELNATHNHLCSAIASEHPNIYCALKHMSTAYVLSNEVDGDCRAVMDIIELLTDKKIVACQACMDDTNQLKEE